MKKLICSMVCLVPLFLSCSEPAQPGELIFEWRLGTQGCEVYGVEQVKASLFSFSQMEPVHSELYECMDGAGQFSSISPGEYTLVIEGKDVNGCTTHEARRDDLILGSGQVVALERPFALVRKRRPIELTWNFANQLDCAGNDVEQVEILLEVEDLETYTEVRACEGFKTSIQADLLPSDTLITVYGISADDQRTLEGTVRIEEAQFSESPCEPALRALVVLDACGEPNCD